MCNVTRLGTLSKDDDGRVGIHVDHRHSEVNRVKFGRDGSTVEFMRRRHFLLSSSKLLLFRFARRPSNHSLSTLPTRRLFSLRTSIPIIADALSMVRDGHPDSRHGLGPAADVIISNGTGGGLVCGRNIFPYIPPNRTVPRGREGDVLESSENPW